VWSLAGEREGEERTGEAVQTLGFSLARLGLVPIGEGGVGCSLDMKTLLKELVMRSSITAKS
jgi:hypothetical protein